MLGQLPLVLFLKLFDNSLRSERSADKKRLFYVALCIKGGLSRALSWNAEENIFETSSPRTPTHSPTHSPTHRTANRHVLVLL